MTTPPLSYSNEADPATQPVMTEPSAVVFSDDGGA